MQKYIKSDLSEIRYFEDVVEVGDWLDLNQYRLMTAQEILKHETNPHTVYHEWNGSQWIDTRSEQEIVEHSRALLPPLTKRQFALYLDSVGLYDELLVIVEQNRTAKIEYDTAHIIERLSPTVSTLGQALDLSEVKIDEMWQQALKL